MAYEFEPKILGIICNWCTYAGADLAGVSRYQYPTNVRLIRVMCSGRVDPAFVLRAFWNGIDGVFIGGCWPGECHYAPEGNYHAFGITQLYKKLMAQIGMNPERLRLEWVSASEGVRFASIMNDFYKKLKQSIGPLGEGEGIDRDELKSRIEHIIKLIPYIKLKQSQKLAASRFAKEEEVSKKEEYDKIYTPEEIQKLIDEAPSYYIDPDKCKGCMICLRRCPVGAIEGGKNQIHVIDQDKCIKCGTCFEVCPPRFGAVKRLVAEPVPPPIPEEARTIARKGEEG
jgi:F420-non-reducing hydrogenase iron-sulfur subunit